MLREPYSERSYCKRIWRGEFYIMLRSMMPSRPSLKLKPEEYLEIAKPYLDNPLGPVGIRNEGRLRNVCLRCGRFGDSALSSWDNNDYVCLPCREHFMDPDVKYYVWYASHCSNYRCNQYVDSRDPELHRCECGGLICASCGACRASCPNGRQGDN